MKETIQINDEQIKQVLSVLTEQDVNSYTIGNMMFFGQYGLDHEDLIFIIRNGREKWFEQMALTEFSKFNITAEDIKQWYEELDFNDVVQFRCPARTSKGKQCCGIGYTAEGFRDYLVNRNSDHFCRVHSETSAKMPAELVLKVFKNTPKIHP